MKNVEQERGIWGALRRWGLHGAMIAFVALLALFLITLVGFFFDYGDEPYANKLASFFGYEGDVDLSGSGLFTRDLGVGLFALGGIAMAAWRNWEMSRQADAAQKQIENESNRIAGERFSDGVKMLAQNENSKPAIAARIGGIYALQPLANNYASQYAAQVVRILVAYVRENTQLTEIPVNDSEMHFLGEDVKAAFAVLAQLLDERNESSEKKFELSDNDLDFSGCDFSHMCLDYRQVNGLRHYRWRGANLQGSDLRRSDLRGSDLRFADFRKARMYGAQLQGADLCGANLEGALLYRADLRGANLKVESTDEKSVPTNLRDAGLLYADLRGADLQGAGSSFATDLGDAGLGSAKLQDTDLRYANLSCVDLPELFSDQIWHSGQPELLNEIESIKISPDREWDLEPYRNCPYALAGVLRNYMVIYHGGLTPSRGLLKAARKLLDDNQLPPGFSENQREWLEKIDPETGSHPDLRYGSFPHN